MSSLTEIPNYSEDWYEDEADVIRDVIADTLREIIFGPLLPNPFISSAERTGTAIFCNELNFARNRLLGELSRHMALVRSY